MDRAEMIEPSLTWGTSSPMNYNPMPDLVAPADVTFLRQKGGRPRGSTDRLPRLTRDEALRDVSLELTPRQVTALETAYTHRVLTVPQFHALLNPHRIRTRLGKDLTTLFRYWYLFRDAQPQKPDEGRKPLVYWLDSKGARELAKIYECRVSDLDWKPNQYTIRSGKLTHFLRTNDIRIAVELSAWMHRFELLVWRDERTLERDHKHDLITLAGPNGQQETVTTTLNPDGYCLLKSPGQRYHRFWETDLSTETGEASKWPTRDWTWKVRSYLTYYRKGYFRKRYQADGMVVQTVTTDEDRLQLLKQITEEIGGREAFWFTTFERLGLMREPTPSMPLGRLDLLLNPTAAMLLTAAQRILTQPVWNRATIDYDERSVLVWK
jgi:Replication-relaxation